MNSQEKINKFSKKKTKLIVHVILIIWHISETRNNSDGKCEFIKDLNFLGLTFVIMLLKRY